jgi:hypothetical protein
LVYDSTSGALNISSNDLANPIKTVTLSGRGVFNGAYIGLSASTFNFNSKRVNSLDGFTFDVTNQGTQPSVNSCSFTTARWV